MELFEKNKENKNTEATEEKIEQGTRESGSIGMENTVSKDETLKQAAETKQNTSDVGGYQFAPDVKLKECKYCRVMIPRSAKICPNCKMHLKKRWLRNLLILLALAALIAGGVYWYVYEYQGQMISVMMTNPADASTANPADTSTANPADTSTTEPADASTAEPVDTSTTEPEQTAGQTEPAEMTGKQDDEKAAEILEVTEQTTESERQSEGTFAESLGVFDNNTGSSEKEEELEIIQPEVTEEDICGADGPILDYADQQIVIFHDYYGMFIYDREAEEISLAVDLEEIGCQYTQGDAACEVFIDADGSNAYLHPMNADEMYVIAVEGQTLTRRPYTEDESEKEDLFAPEETKDCVEVDSTVFRSAVCAELAKGTYLYLESGSGMAFDLCYVVEQNDKVKERVYLFKEYTGQTNEETAADTGESEPIDVSAYTEPAFRNLCQKVSYKALLRLQDIYLNTGVTVELTVLQQIDGGLFDDNIYYLCTAQEDGIQRYYIVRDDRAEDDWLILEGDVLRIYGQLFGSCKVPAELVASQPTVPALTMSYYELLEE